MLETAIEYLESAGATVVDPVEIVDTNHLASSATSSSETSTASCRRWGDAPYDSFSEILEANVIAPPVQSRLEVIIFDLETETLDQNVGYLRRLKRRRELRVDTLDRMAAQDLDALLYPPSTIQPVRIPDHQPFAELNCELAANTGLPSIVVPAGFTCDGLPVGMELPGQQFAEDRLFELVYAENKPLATGDSRTGSARYRSHVSARRSRIRYTPAPSSAMASTPSPRCSSPSQQIA